MGLYATQLLGLKHIVLQMNAMEIKCLFNMMNGLNINDIK